MINSFPIRHAQLFEREPQGLEVIILLIRNGIDRTVHLIIFPACFGRSEVLGEIHRGAVSADEQLFVQPFIAQVDPHRAVFFAVADTLFEAFQHHLLAFQVGLRLEVVLFKINTQLAIGLFKTFINPAVHGIPQFQRFLITGFPLAKHLAGLLHHGSFLCRFFGIHAFGFQCLGLFAVHAGKFHIEMTYEMVSFLARFLRCLSLAKMQPGHHRLADGYAAVVVDIHFMHFLSGRFQDIGHRISNDHIAYMSQMQRLVGIGPAVFQHGACAPVLSGSRQAFTRSCKIGHPIAVTQPEVEKSLNHIETLHSREKIANLLTQFAGRFYGSLARISCKGKDHHRQVSFKFFARHLYQYIAELQGLSVELQNGLTCIFFQFVKGI